MESRIGAYEVLAKLGEGGMGEVYRARDTRLAREVAIKILAPHIAGDAEAVARFAREARALASLNHPNIAAIYGIEDRASPPALVLELVEGDTLAERLLRDRLAPDRAVAIARQIADALDAAHERGIVHRDLKPANIKITPDGTVKVLDFGLAKALASDSADAIDSAATETVATREGRILGTAAYMSPEQARGLGVDKRTDIWAFGCVLFEMLSGRRPFAGATASDTIAAILERAPDWSLLPIAVPRHLRRVIERCLEKDVKRRARDIADVRAQLDEDTVASVMATRSSRHRWLIAAAAALTVAVFAVSLWQRRPAVTLDPEPMEFVLSTPDGMNPVSAAPSPSGDRLAMVLPDREGVQSVWVRSLESAMPVRLSGTEGAVARLYWSRDGRQLAFVADGRLKRIAADGGPVLTICPIVANLGASWGADDVIVFAAANRSPLFRVSASGGQPEAITALDPNRENSHRNPHFLPDGRHFLFTARSDSRANNLIYVGSIDSKDVKPLFAAQSQAIYVEPGYLLFAQEGAVMALAFDVSTLSLTGAPFPVVPSVVHNTASSSAVFNASRNGRVLTFLPAVRNAGVFTWFDRRGTALGSIGPETGAELLRLSPDAARAVFTAVMPDHGTRDIWIMTLDAGRLTRLTSHPATDWSPVWSPDGSEIAFASDRHGRSTAFRVSIDGSGETALYRGEGGVFPTDWTRDRHVFMDYDDPVSSGGGVLVVPIDGAKPFFELQTGFLAQEAQASYDGRFVAYQSNESGTMEVYVKPRGVPGRERVSLEGGTAPRWRRDGRELFFSAPDSAVMAVDVIPGPPLEIGAPRRLFRPCERIASPSAGSPIRFDLTPDGSRILTICDTSDDSVMTVRLHWTAALQKKTSQ